jgi:hypothetical protein
MAAGYTIRISKHGKPFEDWHVALSDARTAMSVALEAAGLSPDHQQVRIFRDLSAADLKRLKLASGHARKVTRKHSKHPHDIPTG